ncbi:MAG: thiolase, partial [Chloroflexi bacterium]|nr:thiolase [Chloroflexota bacterium]
MYRSGAVAIVGVAESDLGSVPDKTVLHLQAQATSRALADAGLTKGDVDAHFTAGVSGLYSLQVSEYLGLRPQYIDSTAVGGASFVIHVEHAAAALAADLCSVALVTYGSTQRSDRSRRLAGRLDRVERITQFEAPYGPLLPISAYAMAAQRHMHQYGTTSEQLASIAVQTRQWAQMNPVAFVREPLGMEDVLASPLVSSPLHLLDCCLVTDGGGALVITSAERAADLPKLPVYVLGSAEYSSHNGISQMPDLTVTGAAVTGPRAFARAGLTPADVDLTEIYDSFTITVLLTLEALGFCSRGEGGAFVAEGRLEPGGSLPTNTNGGGLSYCHPGMYGIFTVIEAVRQLRGECGSRQVPDARVALC